MAGAGRGGTGLGVGKTLGGFAVPRRGAASSESFPREGAGLGRQQLPLWLLL